MIKMKSDFSDNLGLRRAVGEVVTRGILSIFDDVLFHLTIKDEMVVGDRNLIIRMKYRKIDADSMTGRVAMLSFRAVVLKRMDFSYLDSFKPEPEWFSDPIFFSRASANLDRIKQYLKYYIADYHGIRQAIREFPDNMFHFFKDELIADGNVFHNMRKPLYVWSFRGIDNYMYEYLDKLCKCPDIKYQLSLLSEARADRDFLEFAKEMTIILSPNLEDE